MLAAHNLYYAPAYKMHGYVRRGGVASHWPTGELASWQAGKLAKRKALWPEPQFRRHETCINLTFPMPPRSESRKKSEIKWGFSSFAHELWLAVKVYDCHKCGGGIFVCKGVGELGHRRQISIQSGAIPTPLSWRLFTAKRLWLGFT